MASFTHYFAAAVRKNYPSNCDFIIDKIERNFKIISLDTVFARYSSNPIDKRLDFSAYFLALVKTLDEQKETFDNIRSICLDIVLEYVRPKNNMQLFLKRLPAKLANTWLANIIIEVLRKKFSRKGHDDGFLAKVITDKNDTFGFGYGFDILECGICKLFKKHRYEKYASILCEVDEITSSLSGLQLVRTGTIALGAEKCDFRFMKEQ